MISNVLNVKNFVKSTDKNAVAASSDSEDDTPAQRPIPRDFRCRKPKIDTLGAGNLFMIDNKGNTEEPSESSSSEDESSIEESHETSEDIKRVLEKAAVQPGFEQILAHNTEIIGRHATKRIRKQERGKTAGAAWFDMPATEITDENRRDLELLMMRNSLDSKSFYRKNDRTVLPKFFQVGTVVDAAEDFYSSRISRKQRKRTMIDEMLNDEAFVEKSAQKYEEIQQREKAARKAYYRKSGRGDHKKKKPMRR